MATNVWVREMDLGEFNVLDGSDFGQSISGHRVLPANFGQSIFGQN